MIRKTFLLGAAALAATVSLPGRAGPVPATVDKPVTITFYNYNLATAGLGADGTRKLLQEFMAANQRQGERGRRERRAADAPLAGRRGCAAPARRGVFGLRRVSQLDGRPDIDSVNGGDERPCLTSRFPA